MMGSCATCRRMARRNSHPQEIKRIGSKLGRLARSAGCCILVSPEKSRANQQRCFILCAGLPGREKSWGPCNKGTNTPPDSHIAKTVLHDTAWMHCKVKPHEQSEACKQLAYLQTCFFLCLTFQGKLKLFSPTSKRSASTYLPAHSLPLLKSRFPISVRISSSIKYQNNCSRCLSFTTAPRANFHC